MVNSEDLRKIGVRLLDTDNSLADRFRALFTLRNLGGSEAIDLISKAFVDTSALLKHELAFCLGQMQDEYAIPVLTKVLQDISQEAMVRHEAAEALGAIGSPSVVNTLKQYMKDPSVEVAETCELAIGRIRWFQQHGASDKLESSSPYNSVDPTPPDTETNLDTLRGQLLDETKPLFDRYRAMFTLRNMQTSESVMALSEGLRCSSALFRHEIAYVLGQMQHEAAIKALEESLGNHSENPMVRHECAEALGAIAKQDCLEILKTYVRDEERVVMESCKVALDMYEHEVSDQFQYADALQKIT